MAFKEDPESQFLLIKQMSELPLICKDCTAEKMCESCRKKHAIIGLIAQRDDAQYWRERHCREGMALSAAHLEAWKLLKEIEWGTDNEGYSGCPWCSVGEFNRETGERQGHNPGCKLDAFLHPRKPPSPDDVAKIDWYEGTFAGKHGCGCGFATVWDNGAWFTWNENGIGGQNGTAPTVAQAKEDAIGAAIAQGFVKLSQLMGTGDGA